MRQGFVFVLLQFRIRTPSQFVMFEEFVCALIVFPRRRGGEGGIRWWGCQGEGLGECYIHTCSLRAYVLSRF